MSATPNNKAGSTRLTATGTLKASRGKLLGFYVASTNAGTLVLHDASAATNAVTGTITPAIGWNPLPLPFRAGLHAVIGGTALDVTFIFE